MSSAIISAEQAARIMLAWASGAPYYDACLAAGMTRAMARRAKEDPDWMAAHQQARAEFIQKNLQRLDDHAGKTWQAAAWLLERRAPEQFGKRDTLEVTHKVAPLPWQSIVTGEVIDVQAEVMPAKEAEKEVADDGAKPSDEA